MKKENLLVLGIALSTSLVTLSGCNNKKDEKGKRQTKDQLETFEKNYQNKRDYNENFFLNPNNKYRVLPINNASPMSPGGASESKIDEYMEAGYGGIVNNVAPGTEYLTSENNWELMKEAITYGIKTYDMRVMLYDEEYYPSGAARDLTLKATPEGENWEAQGLVNFTKALVKNTPVTIDSKVGHKLIHAYVYSEGSINTINPQNAVDIIKDYGEGSTYTPSSNGLLCLLYSKNWYEGTHYENNLMEARRYIDLLKQEPVQEFINNTYEKYYEHFGEYFGKNVESFFFDEPSLPAFYFTPTAGNKEIIDPLNNAIEQYPAVNFDDKICEKFEAKYGYNPAPYLPYLFEKTNNSKNVRRFRWQYYTLLSEQVEHNWPTQLNEWCNAHNVKSSGHFLCEEDISGHPLTLGNYMNMYQNMGIPGIDLTHGNAVKAVDIASNVAKQATSVGDFIGKQDYFCEIGQDEGAGANVYDNIASAAVMQSMGVNYLTSYYRLKNEEDDALLANSLARINYMIDGNVAEKDVAVYYPIDGVMADETPYNSNGQRIYTGSWGFNEFVSEINNAYRTLLQSFVKNQIDYDIFSNYMIENSTIDGNKIKTPNGETFSTLIIPYTTAMKKSVMDKLTDFANAGVKIVLQKINSLLAESEAEQSNIDTALNNLLQKNNVSYINNTTPSSVLALLGNDVKSITFETNNSNIVARKQDNGSNTMYMLVNTSNKSQTVTMILNETGSEYLNWDVYSGDVNGMCVQVKGGKSYVTVTLDPYRVGIYTIGGTYHE